MTEAAGRRNLYSAGETSFYETFAIRGAISDALVFIGLIRKS